MQTDQKIKILWFDDLIEKKIFRLLIDDFEIKLIRKPLAYKRYLEEDSFGNFDIVITDLTMPGLTGIELYDLFPESVKSATSFCSSNLGNAEYIQELKTRKIRAYRRIDTDLLVTEVTIKKVKSKLRQLFEERNVLKVDIEEYIRFPLEKKLRILNYYSNKYNDFISKHFENSEDKWVLLKPDGSIFQSGRNSTPNALDVLDLIRSEGQPLFLIHRGVIVESICTFRQVQTVEKPIPPHYPSIELDVGKDYTKKLRVDLDTGSYRNFIDHTTTIKLLDSGELDLYDQSLPELLLINGTKCPGISWPIKFKIGALYNGSEVFYSLLHWKDSFLGSFYLTRTALVGRNFIMGHKLTIVIDGENQTTEVK